MSQTNSAPECVKGDLPIDPHNIASVCKWSIRQQDEPCPHIRLEKKEKLPYLESVLDHIGNTPLIKVNRVSAELSCELLVSEILL